ncbi:MAG: YjjG family noncanonical pyrimidine nucleotidase [Oscillospiraceae bacterium]|nr:YjjG family noncanonical pyrimidine nucleotidase [Oscillospiraceae bacterium]
MIILLKESKVKDMYDIVLLDADMTIWDFEASEKLALADTVNYIGAEMTEEVSAFYHEINSALWKAFDLKQVTKEELSYQRFDELLKYVGKEGDPLALNRYYQQRLGEHSIMLPGAEEMCRTLAERCTLYILTNGMHTAQVGRFEKSPIKQYITDMFISEDMGCQKPDKEYYDKVFSIIGLEDKSRAVMVGDSLTSDIRGGINGGVDTIWYNAKKKPFDPNIMPTYTAYSMDEIVGYIFAE